MADADLRHFVQDKAARETDLLAAWSRRSLNVNP